jgi:hypothetical protein
MAQPSPSRTPHGIQPDTAVLSPEQLAEALGVSVDKVAALDLPTIYLGTKTRRYVWRQVVAALEGRAKGGRLSARSRQF